MCVVVPFDHHLFHLCTVPLSLESEPSLPHLMDRVAAVIPHTVGPSPTRLDGKSRWFLPSHVSFLYYGVLHEVLLTRHRLALTGHMM